MGVGGWLIVWVDVCVCGCVGAYVCVCVSLCVCRWMSGLVHWPTQIVCVRISSYVGASESRRRGSSSGCCS